MVSIVVVSHSKNVAQGVVDLASQMTQGRVKFAVAAGIDDPENPIGTDPIAVMAAIQEVEDDDGVLVMMDMGSTILSTDMALELLGEAFATKVHICAAPLVEGTVAAAVAAASGQTIRQVIEEAHQALAAKYRQLSQSDKLVGASAVQAVLVDDRGVPQLTFSWTVTNPAGIHARPASAIATSMSRFTADVQLVKGEQAANAKSMNAIALLAIKCGDNISLRASGEQAREALEAFARLAANHFGDKLTEVPAPEPKTPTENTQHSVYLTATVCRITRGLPPLTPRAFNGMEKELALLSAAIEAAREQLDVLIADTTERLSDNEAAIFTAHRMMLEDGELFEAAEKQMNAQATQVDAVWLTVIEQVAQEYRDIDDPYLRERFIDIYDVGIRVWRCLNAEEAVPLHPANTPTVVVANFLLPSEAARLDPAWIKAIYFTDSGRTSHAAILATALGIPVFMRPETRLCDLQPGATITFDADTGEICAN